MTRKFLIDDIDRSISKNNYYDSIDYITNNISKNEWCYLVGIFGSIKDPGISDIDMLFVISQDEFDKNYNIIKQVIESSPNSKYFFQHGAIIISEEKYPFIKLFHSVENIQVLYQSIELKISKNIQFGLPQILIWNSFFVRAFFKTFRSKVINLRSVLLVLKNLNYSIQYYQVLKDGLQNNYWSKKMNELRAKAMQKHISIEELIGAMKEGVALLNENEGSLFSKYNSIATSKNIIIDGTKLYKASDSISYSHFLLFHTYYLRKIYFIFWDILNMKTCLENYQQDPVVSSLLNYTSQLKTFLGKVNIDYESILKYTFSVPLMGTKKIN